MCSILGVSRSGFYKWKDAEPSQQELRKARLMERIRYHYYNSVRLYGAPKITTLLLAEGEKVTERTVGKYMNELGIRSRVSTKFKVQTTVSVAEFSAD